MMLFRKKKTDSSVTDTIPSEQTPDNTDKSLTSFAQTVRRSRSALKLGSVRNEFGSLVYDDALSFCDLEVDEAEESAEDEATEPSTMLSLRFRRREPVTQNKTRKTTEEICDSAWLRKRIQDESQTEQGSVSSGEDGESTLDDKDLFDMLISPRESVNDLSSSFSCSLSSVTETEGGDIDCASGPSALDVIMSLSAQMSPPGKRLTNKQYLLCDFREIDARLCRLEGLEQELWRCLEELENISWESGVDDESESVSAVQETVETVDTPDLYIDTQVPPQLGDPSDSEIKQSENTSTPYSGITVKPGLIPTTAFVNSGERLNWKELSGVEICEVESGQGLEKEKVEKVPEKTEPGKVPGMKVRKGKGLSVGFSDTVEVCKFKD
ncbi:hypothetical protein BZA70DRAFT_270555 [Myxozyma melibiosi]|uniref:Uncharacterized protein n=1 Tax=Myxozyma melibiosi TaxID=54550 RepID=A0ABR1FBA3_9ASCO